MFLQIVLCVVFLRAVMTYHGQLPEARMSFIAFSFRTSGKITTDQVLGKKSKLESFLIKYLILNPSVEAYKWFSAKCYNERQILNTVAFL